MARSLAERLSSALQSATVRVADLERLITDCETERERLEQAATDAYAVSIDFALGDDERDDSAAKASRYSRTAEGLAKALAELRDKLAERLESDAQKAKRDQRTALLAERDALAERFKAEVPQAVATLVDLLSAIKSNEQRMKAANIYEPDAEAVARDLPLLANDSGSLAFLKMRIPSLDDPSRRAWPPSDETMMRLATSEAEIMRRAKQQTDAERKRWQRYMIEPPADLSTMLELQTRAGKQGVHRQPAIYFMSAEQAEAARQKGCAVRLAKASESVGSPTAVGAF